MRQRELPVLRGGGGAESNSFSKAAECLWSSSQDQPSEEFLLYNDVEAMYVQQIITSEVGFPCLPGIETVCSLRMLSSHCEPRPPASGKHIVAKEALMVGEEDAAIFCQDP